MNRYASLSFGLGTAAWLVPGSAGATQVHASPEGLYAHQMAHMFFAIAMGILLYWLRERRLVKEKGWHMIQLAALFFMLWNLDALVVHFLDGRSDLFHTIDAGTWHASIEFDRNIEALAVLYYLCKMDHLLCVPAMIFLYLGLRTLVQSTCGNPASPGPTRAAPSCNSPMRRGLRGEVAPTGGRGPAP